MPIPASCTHVMLSGAVCQSPAVKGTALCYHHSAVKTALAQASSRDAASAPIPFVFAEDHAGLELNYFLLLQALNEHRTDLRTGNLMLRILRAMDHNLVQSTHSAESTRSAESQPAQSAPKEAPEEKSHSEDPFAHARTFYERTMRQREAGQQAAQQTEQQAAQPQPPISNPDPAVEVPPPDHSKAGRSEAGHGEAGHSKSNPDEAESPSGTTTRSAPAFRPHSSEKTSGMENSMPPIAHRMRIQPTEYIP